MAFVCSITGEVPEIPVISLVSKNVFERRILEKYIQTNGKDPVTNEPMTVDDIIPVKSANISPPKHSNQNNIPSILQMLQDEWDAFVLENYERSKALHSAREELSVSLFHLDSACRVIANLMKENEQLKQTISQMGSNIQLHSKMDIDEQPSNSLKNNDVVSNRESSETKLPSAIFDEKNKNLPPDLVDSTYLSSLKCSFSKTGLHGGANPGINTMDLSNLDDYILTGGNDKMVVLYDKNSDSVTNVFKGHTKRVNVVLFHPSEPLILSGSSDNQIRVWKENVSKAASIIKCHTSPVRGISVHPIGTSILTSAEDHCWTFTDLSTGKPVIKHLMDAVDITSSQIHPDGLIFGIGSAAGVLHIYDFKDCSNVVNFTGHTSAISSIAFSENGYYLCSVSQDASLFVWDLRKAKCVNQINIEDEPGPSFLSFDETGQYLAVGGKVVSLYSTKKWEKIARFEDNTDRVTSVRFGRHAKYLMTSSLDQSLRQYTPS